MDGSMLFDRWRQHVPNEGMLAPPGEYDWICASFGPLESTTQTTNRSVKPLLAQLTAGSAYNLQWAYPSTRIAPSNGGSELSCSTWCFGPIRTRNPNGTSIGSTVFAQMTADCAYTLQWFACFPSKLPLSILTMTSGPHEIGLRDLLGPP